MDAVRSRKEQSVETLRGVAIVLMVAGHVVGSKPEFAMQVPDDSPWRFIFWGLQDLRMPLFTVLSGYIYAIRPTTDWRGYGSLLRAKVRRLLIPLLTVGTLLFWTKLVTPGTNSKPEAEDWWKVYVFGMDHLWFLQAIFLIFLVVGVLDVLGVLEKTLPWALVTGFASVLYITAAIPSVAFFSFDGFIRLLPFFLLGYGFKRFGAQFSGLWLVLLALAAIAAYVPRILSVYGIMPIDDVRLDRTLAFTIGVTFITVLFHYRELVSNRLLAWIGGYAFGIYLFHYFAYSAARIGLRAVGLDNDALVFALGMLCGVGLPIALQVLTRRMSWVRFSFFGEKLQTKARSRAPEWEPAR